MRRQTTNHLGLAMLIASIAGAYTPNIPPARLLRAEPKRGRGGHHWHCRKKGAGMTTTSQRRQQKRSRLVNRHMKRYGCKFSPRETR